MKWKIFLAILILLAVIFLAVKYYPFQKAEARSSSLVTKVIDGDTVELASGKKIRLIGIDAPEEGKPFYLESKNFLKKIVENKEVILEKDSTNADQYGRLLRYVYANDTLANLIMLKQGYAAFYSFATNEKFSKEFFEAEKFARENKLGIWKTSEFSDCIDIEKFNYNAKGDDTKNLNGEYVIFVNICDFEIDLHKWTVSDSGNNKFIFSKFSLAVASELTLFSGKGNNTGNEVYWNNEFPVWNNKGDTLNLRDSEGNLVLTKSYSS